MASSQEKQQQKMKMLMMLGALFLLPLLAMATRVPMEQQGHPDHPDDLDRPGDLVHSDHSDDCIYNLFVQTSWLLFAGTDGGIGLNMFDCEGNEIQFPDLRKIGLMEPDWRYFQLGNLDLFSAKGKCLKSGPCKITLTLNATGLLPNWRCVSVQVTQSQNKMNCTTHFFSVLQWFTRLSPTYTVDNCPSENSIVTESDGHGGLPLPIQSESE